MLLQNIKRKNGDIFVDSIRMIRGNYDKDGSRVGSDIKERPTAQLRREDGHVTSKRG